MDQQKILYSLIILLVLILAFLGGYLFNQKNSEPANISGSLERFSENTPSPLKQASPKLVQISSSKVIAAANGDSDGIFYIEKEGGKVIKTDKDGINRQTVSGAILKNITGALWPPDGSGFIYYAKSLLKELPYYFSLKDGKMSAFSESATSLVFSPDGSKVAYHFWDQGAEEGSISISQPDGSLFKEVIKTRAPALVINWPKESALSFYERAPADKATDLFLVEIGNNRRLAKILENKTGLDVKWSPSGDNLLYSFFEPGGSLKLILKETDSGRETVLPFATFASKCAFAPGDGLLYCGVPIEAPLKPIKPEHLASKDKIVSWDKTKNNEEVVLDSVSFEDKQVQFPFLDPLSRSLFFINSFDEKLYRLAL